MVPGPTCGPSQSPAFKKELEKLNIIAVEGTPVRTGVEQSNDLSLVSDKHAHELYSPSNFLH